MDKKPQFLSTVWTIIEKAKHKDPQAMQEIFLKYKDPVTAFFIKKGLQENAEDLAQEVFLEVIDKNLLEKVDKSKGRFRDFILGVAKKAMSFQLRKDKAQKRGSDKNILSLDEDASLHSIVSEQEKEEFDKLWLLNLMQKAYARLEDECKKNSLLYHVAIKLYLDHDMTYQQIADQMNKTFDEVKNYIYRAKQKIKGYIQDEVAFYSSSVQDYNEELQHLSKYLKL